MTTLSNRHRSPMKERSQNLLTVSYVGKNNIELLVEKIAPFSHCINVSDLIINTQVVTVIILWKRNEQIVMAWPTNCLRESSEASWYVWFKKRARRAKTEMVCKQRRLYLARQRYTSRLYKIGWNSSQWFNLRTISRRKEKNWWEYRRQ